MRVTNRVTGRLTILVGGLVLFLCQISSSSQADPLSEILDSDELRRLHSGPAVNDRKAPPNIAENGEYWSLFKDPERGPGKLFGWLGDPALDYELVKRHILKTDDFIGVHAVYKDSKAHLYRMQILVPHPKRYLAADAGLIAAFHEMSESFFNPDAVDRVQVGRLSGMVLTRVSGQCLLKIPLERHAWFTVSQSEKCGDPMSLSRFAESLFLDRVNLKLAR